MIKLTKVASLISAFCLIFTHTLTTTGLAEEKKSREQKLLLWKVDSKPGSLYSVYILGSYHIGKECEIDNSPAFKLAFKDAETVTFEIDSIDRPEQISVPAQQYISRLIQQKGIPSNKEESLREFLDKETYELLQEKTDAIDFPLDNFARLKPWVFVFTYSSILMSPNEEYKVECGIDYMVAEQSRQEDKTILGLETIELQLEKYTNIFVSLESEEIKEFLEAIAKIESLEEVSEYVTSERASAIDNVSSGDIDYLELSIENWCKDDLESCESLLFSRNRDWIPQIENFLKQKKDTLLVVGAGHLVGEQNVLQLLKEKGYRVRRFYDDYRLIEE